MSLVLLLSVMRVTAQNITQSDINTTCFVLSELVADAKEKGDATSILIYSNTIDKIKKRYNVHPNYSKYFDSIKKANPNLKGIVISLNNPPKSPGFSNKEIDDFMLLSRDGISLSDFNDFLVLKKLGQQKLRLENLNELELKNIKTLKERVESINIRQ